MRPKTLKVTVKQRQEKLFKELDLSGLESWPPKLADSAWSLLAEYHDIFSLEPSKLCCTHSTKHVIKVTDNTPFKEWFRLIPLLLVEEVCTHLQEMLDSDVIHPSQSVWCNVVVLVWKKDRGLHFCIDFCCLNAHMKKDSYPLPRILESLKSLVGAGHFSHLDLKIWILANQDGWVVKTVHHLYHWQFRLLQVWPHAFWTVQCTSHISAADAKLPQGTESDILPHLPQCQSFSYRWLKNTFTVNASSLTNLESIIWNWSHQNAAFSEKRSPIWHIESKEMGCYPVIWNWK